MCTSDSVSSSQNILELVYVRLYPTFKFFSKNETNDIHEISITKLIRHDTTNLDTWYVCERVKNVIF